MTVDHTENKTLIRALRNLALPHDCPLSISIMVKSWATKVTQTHCYDCEVAEIYHGYKLIGAILDDNGRARYRGASSAPGVWYRETAKQFKARVHGSL